ncbi:hypothetical protein ACPUET_04585 [Paraburkholderia graminis]|uniref:hypothetical protein n=1 Tax=Paraburkholderia graminis TaxID=60548 RepID=UPI003CAB0E27
MKYEMAIGAPQTMASSSSIQRPRCHEPRPFGWPGIGFAAARWAAAGLALPGFALDCPLDLPPDLPVSGERGDCVDTT